MKNWDGLADSEEGNTRALTVIDEDATKQRLGLQHTSKF